MNKYIDIRTKQIYRDHSREPCNQNTLIFHPVMFMQFLCLSYYENILLNIIQCMPTVYQDLLKNLVEIKDHLFVFNFLISHT